jgi:YgiT-type zinc finger domain-containing protein
MNSLSIDRTLAHFIGCVICGKTGGKIRRASRCYGEGDTLIVIENIPVVTCSNCGESYLTAETLYEIGRIKSHRQAMAEARPVPVAVFA